ncbi:hypothetical protein [Paractinoplanes brasiliensis]|uniref:Uncharacterized protein n=1 Tax=Paractinoplanes brasiliensis TaxID=52695 RepID=A0A4R6JMW8_9ACTN|nr:hypothetical protein [Actinoplanes brasiliensis]TDO37082.1 hypothetical protein C8E87_0677 [Actinoplanes brasiliensis]GID32224.1 hypothetical protein Abr02nite_72070 [Actinoplanes brasiliensis]
MAPALWPPRRRRDDDESLIVQHTVGNAIVLHAPDAISVEAQSLALSVNADEDNDVVVLDLGDGLAIDSWESMAGALPRHRRGIRLMACGRNRASAAMAGQWLSERLNRTVIAPDGDLVRGAGGALLVHSIAHSGWVRFRPGRPPSWDAKRFPVPAWDRAVTDNRPTSANGEVEPLPGAVWVHDTRYPGQVAEHRRRLVEDLPCHPETMPVLLGCPGTPPLSLDDVVRFWRDLDPDLQARTRFVEYGQVRRPEGETLGQALADLLAAPVTCYTGVPSGTPRRWQVRAVRPDGTLGWSPFATELRYTPRAHENTRARRPEVLSHRPPLRWTEEVGPRVYWYAPDAVVEVVEAGLWMRSTDEPAGAERVRATALDPRGAALIFDDSDAKRAERMRELALDLGDRLPGPTPRTLLAASMVSLGVRTGGRADATIDHAAGPAGDSERTTALILADLKLPAVASPPVAPPAVAVTSVVEAPPKRREPGPTQALTGPTASLPVVAPRSARATIEPAPAPAPAAPAPAPAARAHRPVSAAAGAPTAPPAVLRSMEPVAPPSVAPPSVPPVALPPVEPVAPSVASPSVPPVEPPSVEPVVAPHVVPPSVEPVVLPDVTTASPAVVMPVGMVVPVDIDVPAPAGSEPAPTPDAPAEPPPAPAAKVVSVQPVPAAAATAVLPKRSLDQERDWLRRTLSEDFDRMASSVSRIMSEQPGLQSGGTPAANLLADSVAVRLYLTRRGERVDSALRTGAGGPHVPFARCVVAGLSRLPSFRGSTIFRVTPDEREWALYGERKLLTDWSLVNTLTQPHEGQDGDTDLLIWSMTARRTALLEPDGTEGIEDRVLFLPGTSFKVLETWRPREDQRGGILLREIGANEIDEEGRVDRHFASLDELAVTGMHRSLERWSQSPAKRAAPAEQRRFRALPGLDQEGERR